MVSKKEKIKQLEDKIETLNEKLDKILFDLRGYYWDVRTDLRNHSGFASIETLSMGSCSKILIMGFYGARNLGDELMLRSILDFFEKKKMKVTIMLSDNYNLDASVYYPHDIIHYPRKSDDFTAIANNFDVVIWGGGAVIDDNNYRFDGFKTPLIYSMLSISKAVIKKGGDVIVLGVSSVRELQDVNFIRDLKYIVDNSKFFSLRDTFSLETLERAGIDVGRVEVIDDIALAQLDSLDYEAGKKEKEKKSVGLVFIMSEDNKDILSCYMEGLLKYAKNSKKRGNDVEFIMIPFYDYENNDIKIGKSLLSNEKDKQPIIWVDNIDSIDKLKKVFDQCDVVISMRYHAALIASCLGLNVILLDYDSKHKHYYNKNRYIKQKYNQDTIAYSFGCDTGELVNCVDEVLRNAARVDDERMKLGKKIAEASRKKIDAVLSDIKTK